MTRRSAKISATTSPSKITKHLNFRQHLPIKISLAHLQKIGNLECKSSKELETIPITPKKDKILKLSNERTVRQEIRTAGRSARQQKFRILQGNAKLEITENLSGVLKVRNKKDHAYFKHYFHFILCLVHDRMLFNSFCVVDHSKMKNSEKRE